MSDLDNNIKYHHRSIGISEGENRADDLQAGINALKWARRNYQQQHQKPKPRQQYTRSATKPAIEEEKHLVKVRPLMAFAAIHRRCTGGYRLWALAHAMDKPGSGVVQKKKLRAFVVGLGVNERTYRRWLKQALFRGFLMSYRGGMCYKLRNVAKVAGKLKAAEIDKHQAHMPAEDLVTKSWRAHVWAAFVNGKTISRRKLQESTGIMPETQRNYEAAAGVITTANYTDTIIRGEHIEGIKDCIKPHAFVAKNGTVSWRLPNTYTSKNATNYETSTGRFKKIKSELKNIYRQNDLSDAGRELCRRIFYDKRKAASKAARRIDETEPGEVYAKQPTWTPRKRNKSTWVSPAALWEVFNTGVEYRL